MRNLENYDVIELSKREAREINGGNLVNLVGEVIMAVGRWIGKLCG